MEISKEWGNPEEEPMLFAGCDPGVYSTTIAVVNSCSELVAYHQIYASEDEYPRTPNKDRKKGQRYFDPIPEQIAEDHIKFIDMVFSKYKILGLATEKMEWSAKHSDTQGWVHHFRGILHACCMKSEVPFYMINPQQIKKVVTGNGNASKDAVVISVYNQFKDKFPNFSFLSKQNHIADAIGAGLFLVQDQIGYIEE
ncbi:MAG: crossover junction endodeoxyribonuclease RuvC [Candidatus Izemoplasmatales bacterium]